MFFTKLERKNTPLKNSSPLILSEMVKLIEAGWSFGTYLVIKLIKYRFYAVRVWAVVNVDVCMFYSLRNNFLKVVGPKLSAPMKGYWSGYSRTQEFKKLKASIIWKILRHQRPAPLLLALRKIKPTHSQGPNVSRDLIRFWGVMKGLKYVTAVPGVEHGGGSIMLWSLLPFILKSCLK